MSEPWDKFKDDVAGVIKDSLKGFLEGAKVDEFVKAKAADFARERYLAEAATDAAKREEHLANLRHLTAQVKGEAMMLAVSAATDAKATLGRILEVAGGLLVKIGPKILAGL